LQGFPETAVPPPGSVRVLQPLGAVNDSTGEVEISGKPYYLSWHATGFRLIRRAVAEGGAQSGAVGVHKAAQQGDAPFRTDSQESPEVFAGCDSMRDGANECYLRHDKELTPTGFEPVSQP
jgi:hypothetical protein